MAQLKAFSIAGLGAPELACHAYAAAAPAVAAAGDWAAALAATVRAPDAGVEVTVGGDGRAVYAGTSRGPDGAARRGCRAGG